MKIAAIYNLKGGVGKTATAANLGYLAAEAGHRVLIWDLDPQGAATFYFRIQAKVKGGGKKLIKGKRSADDAIKGTDFERLDLLPADFSYRKLDQALNDDNKASKRLSRMLKPLAAEYDYVFIDCPPNISPLAEAVFAAAELLLVPVIPTSLSLRTWEQIKAFQAKRGDDDLKVKPFFSLADRRKKLHCEVIEAHQGADSEFLEGVIPYATDVERMGLERAPVCHYAQRSSRANQAFRALWTEVEPLLRG